MNKFLIRLSDFVFSFIGLLLLLPVFILISIWIKLDSKGAVFYKQKRVGKGNEDFVLWKFRTMLADSEKHGLITSGHHQMRITRVGRILRKYKLDELPQLINVLKGEMSLVGPRPEVREFVNQYNAHQLKVLDVRPGITDYASIEYFNESELLNSSQDPLKTYVEIIMAEKLELNLKFIQQPTYFNYLKLLWMTIRKIIIN